MSDTVPNNPATGIETSIVDRTGKRRFGSVRGLLAAAVLGFAFAAAPALAPGQQAEEYTMGAGDKLNITVFGHKDLSGVVVVDGSGRIALPLLGTVEVDNKTVAEVQAYITEALDRDFIVDPKVSIEIANHRPFFILGQVNKPGSYSYIEGMTVRMAVALAGGFTRRARESSVVVIRANDPEQKRIEAVPDALVLPGDTIEVERRLF